KRRLAELYLQQKDYAKANELADQLLKDSATDPAAQFIKGWVLLGENKTTEAVAELQKFIKTRPLDAAGRFVLGLAYLHAQEPERAESEFNAAIQNDSAYVQAYLPLAQLKLKSGDPEATIRYARQALTLDNNLDDAHLLIASA